MLGAIKRPSKSIHEVRRVGDALLLNSRDGMLKLEPKSAEIIRVVYTLKDSFANEEKPGVIYKDSYPGWHYQETDSEIRLYTDRLCLSVNKATASIRYCDPENRLILAEREYESKILEEFDSYKVTQEENLRVEHIMTADGEKEVVKSAEKEFDRKLYKTKLYLNWQKEEALYGLGQQEEGSLNLRGTTVYLHQANQKIAIPLLISSLGYGILMDTYSPMIFSDNEFGSYLYTEADYELDYYFIYGGSLDGVIRGYRYLTGKASMLPKWAFGFVQSQERYETAQELQEIVKEYRKRGIGLDCIVLDWCSWEGQLWGQKSFDSSRFPEPSAMMEELHDNHAKLMISIWPNMSRECDNYKEFKEQGLLLGASNIYDPYKPEGRQLYWKQTYEGLFCHGIDAWWCDSSEPFAPEWNHLKKPEPGAMYHEFYETSGHYIAAPYLNSYGLYHARTMYEGQRAATQEKRVVNLTRNGYTGQQRYGAVLWSGDISAKWSTFKKQIAAGLNFCASGIPYWTLDIGAFFVKRGLQWYWDGDYEQGTEDLGYRELFTRWFQLGCFLPVFRSHGTDFRRELWNFSDNGEVFYDALIKMNHLRYQLMPYIYSIAARVWKEDYTMYRLLAFDFAEDARVRNIDDQFMFGESLMVCPVTKPMYYERGSRPLENIARTREVYLPEGTGWYDFWTNQHYEGGQTITAAAPLSTIPVYVREGSIIPMTQAMQYVDEVPDASYLLQVYSGRDAGFELYEDEGDGYRYEQGAYTITKLIWSQELKKLTVKLPEGDYPNRISDREYRIHIVTAE